MILVRDVFQVKFGHMDPILAILKEAEEIGIGSDRLTRVLTDVSGQMFTLVFEAKVESIDAHLARMQESFNDPELSGWMGRIMEHVDSGRREFYTIEWES
jgi:hypothetical protein